MPERLSQESLEALCVAICQLKTESGLVTNLSPQDVLQPWVLENLPNFQARVKES